MSKQKLAGAEVLWASEGDDVPIDAKLVSASIGHKGHTSAYCYQKQEGEFDKAVQLLADLRKVADHDCPGLDHRIDEFLMRHR